MAVGRISGPLLKDNLLRNGVNLAFETNLLYLDVVNSRVGINTTAPTNDLSVNGTTRTTNLTASNSATLADISISGSTISTTNSVLTLSPNGINPVVYQGTINVGNIGISGNTIVTLTNNTDINISPSGTGNINLNSDTLINGNLHVTGNITADAGSDGNIKLGNQATDTVTFDAEVNSDIIPSAPNTYNLGSSTLQWNNVYAVNANYTNITATTVTTTDFQTAGLDISGNSITARNTNSDINLITSGTGGISINQLKFSANTLTNTVPNGVTNFNNTSASSNFTASIAPGASIQFTASITGNILSVSSTPSWVDGGNPATPTITIGWVLSGSGIVDGTFIKGNLSGTGTSSSSTWTVSYAQTVNTTTINCTPIIMTVTGSPTGTIENNMIISGNGVIPGTNITAFASGTGSAGTYYVTPSQSILSEILTGIISSYVKVSGTYGVVIPSGGTSSRPINGYYELGMMRYNTDYNYVEIFNGTVWITVAGTSSGVTQQTANDIALGVVLSLG